MLKILQNIHRTAIPSGILCNVTENISIFSFFLFLLSEILSAIILVIIKKIIPDINPIDAGNQLKTPCSSANSADGNINDHILAEIIIPIAKPIINFCIFSFKFFFKNSTNPLPNDVPINGITIPKIL